MDHPLKPASIRKEIMQDIQRRVRDVNDEAEASEDADFEEAVILESDETSWVLIGEIWVDVSRIVTVGPMYDDTSGEPVRVDNSTTVQLDVPHDDAKFIHAEGLSVEETMGRILDATTTDEDEDND